MFCVHSNNVFFFHFYSLRFEIVKMSCDEKDLRREISFAIRNIHGIRVSYSRVIIVEIFHQKKTILIICRLVCLHPIWHLRQLLKNKLPN